MRPYKEENLFHSVFLRFDMHLMLKVLVFAVCVLILVPLQMLVRKLKKELKKKNLKSLEDSDAALGTTH